MSAGSPTARCSRRNTSRTSSSSSPTSGRRWRSATAATTPRRSSTSTSRRSATGPSGTACAYASYQELAAKPEVYDLIQGCVEQVNRDLAQDAKLAGSQIKRFLILHKELDADDGELTRTRKVRRRFIAERYVPLIEALFSDVGRAHIETTVTFEDGRTGLIKADLEVREAARSIAAPAPLKKAS